MSKDLQVANLPCLVVHCVSGATGSCQGEALCSCMGLKRFAGIAEEPAACAVALMQASLRVDD